MDGESGEMKETEVKFKYNRSFFPKGSKVWIFEAQHNLVIQCKVKSAFIESEAKEVNTVAEAMAAETCGVSIAYDLDEPVVTLMTDMDFFDTREEAEKCLRSWWADKNYSGNKENRQKLIECLPKDLNDWRGQMVSDLDRRDELIQSYPHKSEGEEWFRIPVSELVENKAEESFDKVLQETINESKARAEYVFKTNYWFYPKGSKVWVPIFGGNMAIQCEVTDVYVFGANGLVTINDEAQAIKADKEGRPIFYDFDEPFGGDFNDNDFGDTREEVDKCIRDCWAEYPVEDRKERLDLLKEQTLSEWRDGVIAWIRSTNCGVHYAKPCPPDCACPNPCCKVTNEEWVKGFPYTLKDKKEGEEWFVISKEELLKL